MSSTTESANIQLNDDVDNFKYMLFCNNAGTSSFLPVSLFKQITRISCTYPKTGSAVQLIYAEYVDNTHINLDVGFTAGLIETWYLYGIN